MSAGCLHHPASTCTYKRQTTPQQMRGSRQQQPGSSALRSLRTSAQHLAVVRSSRRSATITCALKVKRDSCIVCSKTLVAQPGHEAEVLELCQQAMAFSHQQMKDKPKGICEFNCHQDIHEPNIFHFWERYDGNRQMGEHNTTEQMQHFMEKVQGHLQGPVGMALYEWKDGQLGHSCVHGGPKGEGGLDDATGAGGAGGASMKQTSATVDLTGTMERDEEKGLWGLNIKFPWMKKGKDKK